MTWQLGLSRNQNQRAPPSGGAARGSNCDEVIFINWMRREERPEAAFTPACIRDVCELYCFPEAGDAKLDEHSPLVKEK